MAARGAPAAAGEPADRRLPGRGHAFSLGPAFFGVKMRGCCNGWVNFGALIDRLWRVKGKTLGTLSPGTPPLEKSRNFRRPAFLDICFSGAAVGRVFAISYQNQYFAVFSGWHPGRNHWRPSGAPVARFAGPSQRSSRVHSWDAERSLRSAFQDIAAEPGSILCTERSGGWNSGS